MRLPRALKGCKLGVLILILIIVVVGTAYRRDFKQMLEDEEAERKQQWLKVNESHEYWKMKDSADGRVMQHIYPSLLTKQEQLYSQQRQKRLSEEKRKQEEIDRHKARIALEKQRKVNEQRVNPTRSDELKPETNPGEIFLPNDLEALSKRS